MSRKRKPFPLLEGVRIESVAAEGKSIARVGGMVVFVPFAVPGDVVDLRIRKKRGSYCEAEVSRVITYSALRVRPMCRHFGACGGCAWQMLPYEEQLRVKERQVRDQLTRIAKVPLPDVLPIIGSEKTREYRNKLDFGCSNKRWLTREEIASLPDVGLKDEGVIGFHVPGAFDKVLPIEECCLMDGLHNDIRNEIRDYARGAGMTFYDIRRQRGLLRGVIIRRSSAGEWMVIVQFRFDESGDERRALSLLGHVSERFPQITSLMYVNNRKGNDTIADQDVVTFRGRGDIRETMEDLTFNIGPKSFYQTNSAQALRLYTVARAFAGLTGGERVYDLYTGTGTIAQFVARRAVEVIGIEYVSDAIADAKANASLNGITNTRFFAGDMKDVLTDDFVAANGQPDVVITDPPRAGMHPDVVARLLRAAPQRIVYVSCNPATQARDIAALAAGYDVTAIQPVDMFPHTPHVENVVLLERRHA